MYTVVITNNKEYDIFDDRFTSLQKAVKVVILLYSNRTGKAIQNLLIAIHSFVI